MKYRDTRTYALRMMLLIVVAAVAVGFSALMTTWIVGMAPTMDTVLSLFGIVVLIGSIVLTYIYYKDVYEEEDDD